MKKSLMALCVALILNGVAFAQPDRTESPQPAAPKSVELPAVEKSRLENGVEVWTVERRQVPVVSMWLVLNLGATAAPPSEFGLADFTSSLLEEGAAGKSALELSDELDFLGANYSSSTNFDATRLTLSVPRARLDEALKVFADMVLRPDFRPDDIERVKKKLRTSLRQNRDSTSSVASYFFPRLLYPEGHRYADSVTGADAAIASFEQSDLQGFHQAVYQPGRATIIIVGDITSEEATAKLNSAFAGWSNATEPFAPTTLPEAPQVARRNVVIVDKPGAAQTTVMIGWLGVERRTSDYYTLQVLNTILGDSFTSRLNQNLREQHGYTYGAGSAFVTRKEAGPFYAMASVQTDKTGPALGEFFKELSGIREVVPEEELEKAKNYLAYRFPSEFETNSDVAGNLSTLEIYSLPEDTYSNYVQNIRSVTAAQVQEAAKQYIDPERMIVLLVGDRAVIEEDVKALDLGPLQYRDRMEGLEADF